MYRNLIIAIVLIFFAVGLVTVISLILMRAVYPDKKSDTVIVCPFGREDRECAVRVSCIISILTVLGLLKRCRILILDKGMFPDERENILYSFGREPDVRICDGDKLKEFFFKDDDGVL